MFVINYFPILNEIYFRFFQTKFVRLIIERFGDFLGEKLRVEFTEIKTKRKNP